MTPRRIQRRRTRGWRLPEGAVYVGRPTRWGNPWRVGQEITDTITHETRVITARDCVDFYSVQIRRDWPALLQAAETELAGRDLVCWCPLDQPCHADVLLDLANRTTPL